MDSKEYGALIRTLIFTVLVPGTVTVIVPYFLLPSHAERGISGARLFGLVPMALGLGCYFWCAWGFALKGGGTPAPIDPPKTLVVNGPYRYVRNPMYWAIESLLAGEAVLFASWRLAEYAAIVAAAFFLFVILYEERALKKKFGAAYEDYCKAVPRWIPKRRAG